jgi:hypothetical protein
MSSQFITEDDLGRYLWVPFNLPETMLEPGVEQTVTMLQLAQGQRATLSWLSVHLIRMLVLSAPPMKNNPTYNSVYAGLYGSRADLLAGPPGEPLAYVGVDIPGTVGVFPPAQVWPLDQPDTYGVFVVNNLNNPPVYVSVSGAWLIHL